VIVTNGKLWRLYSKRTHSRSTNYYEIDLEEVFAQTGSSAADPANAFRYFWILFRRQSLEPTTVILQGKESSLSFLDVLLVESENYAKELGERLKERVFEDVFPHLASGFIEHIRQNREAAVDISSQLLDRVFQGTLTLLYRLLFLLYAESRDLLPVKETRGYFDISLTKLKNQTAIAAENIEDEVPEKLKRRYRTDSYTLYDRLAELFNTIDRGNAALNVPFYNGGLFLSDPDPADDTPEAEAARFLNQTKVSDRHLSLALDLLSRAEDNKSHALVFIDYKSLGVRQLGSIYEGLLEFKLQIAEGKLAVVSEKGREVYVEFKELNQQKRDRAERLGRIVKKGDVYLENDKRERKATGSYYTPDYIVKFIVQHAVGPVIEKKFEAIRSSFREAQKWHKEAIISAKAKKESPAKYEFGPAVERKWQSLIDDFFDIKVLDPAMGSGHFLVEAVDLITDKALAFLNAFPWNPILAYLASTRETILQEMESQGISVDPKRLDDINLLKRHVLKRCIHGVDRNPMAVELAKVSLWLDCFTLGAPLSFLDHHLRCGDSLVGVGVEEVRQAIESVTAISTKAKVAASPTEWKTLTSTKHQYDLFGGRFSRLLKATELMRHVGEMSDVTSSQVRQSRSEYLNASSALQPFKRILDIYTSHWFGNEAKANSQSRKAKPAAIEFLKHANAEDVINAHGSKELECALIKLAAEDRDLVGRALRVAQEQRFFHWELEFPEVFYGPTPGTRHEIEHLADGGFDVLIGNPPFIDKKRIVRHLKELDSFWKECGQFSTAKGIYDVYMLFLEQAAKLCKRGGRFGLLTPIPWLTQTEGADLRKQIVKWGALELADFSSDSHFSDALVKVVAVIMKRGITSSSVTFRTNSDIRIQTEYIREKVFNGQFRLDVLPELIPILEKIYLNSVSLNTLYTPTFGLRACSKETGGFDKEFLIRRKEDCKNAVPYLEASDIRTQQLNWPGRWLDYQPELMYSPRSPELFLSPKILAPSLLGKRKIRAVYDDQGYFVDQSLVCISAEYDLPKIPQNVYRPSLQATTLQLNSATISFYFAHAVVGEALGGGAIHATPGLIGKLRVFNQSSLERATAETVDGLIWDICELSDQERNVIIRWHADL
jgi:Eco57I restriction-modification methylase/TaqI-like C-terminal specificity domain